MADINFSVEYLRSRLDYNSETGIFRWKVISAHNMKVGDIAGGKTSRGYTQIRLCGKKRYAHRLAWMYCNGVWPDFGIDHIDGNPSNNSIDNLREATQAENMQNIKKARFDNASGFIGVHKCKYGWVARITVDKVQRNIGHFQTPEVAHLAYIEAKRQAHPFGTI